VLGHRRHDVDGEPVGLREVDRHELGSALHQRGDEVDVAGEPIELGDHQHRLVQAAQAQRLGELGPVVALAALDLGDDPAARDEAAHRLLLGFEPEAGATLALGRDAVIGDDFADRHGCDFSSDVGC
jgi:hypothetical protein